MHTFKKLKLLYLVFNVNFFYFACHSHHTRISFCGKIQIQKPFVSADSTGSSPLSQMILCRSQKLYFRTSLGLFPVSSIDYTNRTLTISHPSCSSSRNYVSPSVLSAGFPSPPQPNSLLLFNCLNTTNYDISSFAHSCSPSSECAAPSKSQNQDPYPCLVVGDTEKVEKGFHPKDMSCSHYRRVYRSSRNDLEGYELGTRISFDIPDHVPNICNECEKPNGNCGVGLRCICHPQECKGRVISKAGLLKPNYGYILLYPGSVVLFLIQVILLVTST